MATWRPDRYGGLRALLGGVDRDAEIREEFEHHIEQRVAGNLARGMSPAAAREDALRRFGDLERFRSETRAVDDSIEREARRMELMDAMKRELRQAGRGLLRAPGFVVVAVVTLALGLGAAAAVYTLLDRVVLSPLPYPTPERLVLVDHPVPGLRESDVFGAAPASYFHFRANARTLDDLAVYATTTSNVRTGGSATQAEVALLSANLFDVLGARPALGRLLQATDDRPDAAPVAVLSYDYWQLALGGRPDVVGMVLERNGNPAEIVGVAAPGFALPFGEPDVYVALRFDPAGPFFNEHYLTAIGRMRQGTTPEAVQAELARLTAQLPEAHPSVYDAGFMEDTRFTVRLRDLREAVAGDVVRLLWIALGAVLLVLVIAAVNVANLFLVRNEARLNEMAIRRALGASTGHIAVQSFAESLLVALLAGVLGSWLAYGGLRLVLALVPEALPRMDSAALDGRTYAFVLGLALLSALLLAAFPLLRRIDWSLLRGVRTMTGSRRRVRVRSALVAAQIALSVVLLSGAGLMVRSFAALRATKSGLHADNVVTVPVSLPGMQYAEPGAAPRFWRVLAERIGSVPGVQHVGATTRVPMIGDRVGCAVMVVDPLPASDAELGCVPNSIVTPGYFEALGIRVEGRVPTWTDIDNGSGAVVISRSLAEALWPGESALGRGLRVPAPGDAYYRIVGIADDVRHEGLDRPAPQKVYYPVEAIDGAPLWGPRTALVLLVRTGGMDPVQLTGTIRRITREMEPGAAIGDVRTMRQIVGRSMARTSFIMALLGVAGLTALILSIVGLYGVVAYTANRRRAEIGIRMALGANTAAVGGMVVRDALRLGAIGVAAGLAGALLTTGTLRSLLHGVEPTDALTLATVALVLLGVTALASFVPAQRAARTDPAEVLRA